MNLAGRSKRLSRQFLAGISLTTFFLITGAGHGAENWQATVSKDPPGNFPELRPLRATYNFGWAGLTAATAEAHFYKPSDDRLQLEGTGRTVGLARALWRYDVNYRALADAANLHPIETRQAESVRSKKAVTNLTFNTTGVNRAKTEGPGAGTTKTKQFVFPGLLDLQTAFLYLRSQPLKDGTVWKIVVYPEASAYLATVTVIGHEKINVHAGSFKAIKASLQLSKLDKNLELVPHKKFRRASVWISDDNDRMLLRVEAQIFVGTVFAELQSIKPDNPKSQQL